MKVIKVIILALLMIDFVHLSEAREIPAPSAARLTPAVIAVKNALPWVVSIGTNEEIIQVNDPFALFFTEFFGNSRAVRTHVEYSPLGSGVIVDSQGLVLTNAHVVRRAPQIEVRLWNGDVYQAHVVGYDDPNDLCVLQLEGDFSGEKKLSAANFAWRHDLLLGETVLAIGNPFGLEHSVSQGTLSAFNRSFEESGFTFSDILQIDASINPGNSGGPLVNLDSQLIAINLALKADAQGIGFAIPLSRIEDFLGYWLKPSHFCNGYLGMAPEALIVEAENDEAGVTISEIMPDSPLARAGITNDSVIVSVDGRPVARPIDFSREIWYRKQGDSVCLTTSDGKKHALKVEAMPVEMMISIRLGIKVTELTSAVRANMAIPEGIQGVMVTDVSEKQIFSTQNTNWHRFIHRGDVIASFDGHEITTIKKLAEEVSKSLSRGPHSLGIYSGSRMRNAYVPMVINQLYLH